MDYAKLRGWRIVHIRNVKVNGIYTVPYEGDTGLPDLILARAGRVVLAELKSERGRPTPAQQSWVDAAHGFVWRPSSWPLIVEELR